MSPSNLYRPYAELAGALAGQRYPCAFVDLDAFDRNVARHAALVAEHGLPLRIATKSLRVPNLIRRALDYGGAAFHGLLCFSCEEATLLTSLGFDDLLIAYPAFQDVDLVAIASLVAQGKTIRLVVDSHETMLRLQVHAAQAKVTVSVVFCLDMALVLGPAFLGVRRSPLRTAAQVLTLARATRQLPNVRLVGLMGYEAQVAGLGDDNPFDRSKNIVKRAIREVSMFELSRRRVAIVKALVDDGFALELVNGGGTGSLDVTTRETGVTEVAAGSGFFKPLLFDYFTNVHMKALEPSCFFALEITRIPAPGFVTCLGGGYVASGAISEDKSPQPVIPTGCSLIPSEMVGEVQTPLRVRGEARRLGLGDFVVFRHAKAGELMERFREVLLISGGRVVESVPTYRGLGACFF